jgi:hypothetical protein
MKDLVKHPIILGAEYIHTDSGTVAILESFDWHEDFIRLKCLDSPWIFESNHATFSLYWKLQRGRIGITKMEIT